MPLEMFELIRYMCIKIVELNMIDPIKLKHAINRPVNGEDCSAHLLALYKALKDDLGEIGDNPDNRLQELK